MGLRDKGLRDKDVRDKGLRDKGVRRRKAVLVKVFVPLAVFSLVAAACGSDGSSDTAATSPLAEFLGNDTFVPGENDEEAQARFAEQEREREEAIAQCMSEQGFEYIPVDNSNFNFAAAGPDGLEWGSREWTEKYGFGFTTQRFSQEEVGPDLVGWDDSFFEDQEVNDPNSAIVEAMDESTRQAYQEALYGDESSFPTIDPETMTEEEIDEALEDFDFEPQGCQAMGFENDPINNFYRDFQDELEDMNQAIQDDPRVLEVQQKITDCVSDKGFAYSGIQDEDFYMEWETRVSEVDALMGGFPGEDLTEEDFATMSEDELDAIFSQPREMGPEAKALLGEIQADEIETALAVYDCGGGFTEDGDLADVYATVTVEYEQRFLDTNAERLADYKAG